MKASVALAANTVAAANAANWNGTYWNGSLPAAAYPSNGAAAACTPTTSTVYLPFTETLTVYSVTTASPSSVEAAGMGHNTSATPSCTTALTITSVLTHTNTVTEVPTTRAATMTSTSSAPYIFHVTSGSTIWENGNSPSSGVSLAIQTSAVTLLPVPSTSEPHMATTVTTTSHTLHTFTVPPYSSTTFSLNTEDLTTTLTSTSYSTIQVSQVSSRSSFPGVNSAGWNATTTESIILPAPEVSTVTMVVMQADGNATSTTITNQITSTIGDGVTQTLNTSAAAGTGGSSVSEQPVTTTKAVGGSIEASSSESISGAPVSAESASVEISETFGTGLSTTSTFIPSPSAHGLPSNSSGFGAAQITTPSKSSSVSYLTITSFLFGSGTTSVLTSTLVATPRIITVNGTVSIIPAATDSSSRRLANSTWSGLGPSLSTATVDSTTASEQSLAASEASRSSSRTDFEATEVLSGTDTETTTLAITESEDNISVTSISTSATSGPRGSSVPASTNSDATFRTSRSSAELSSSTKHSTKDSPRTSRSSSTSSSRHSTQPTTTEGFSTRSRNGTITSADRPTKASTFSNLFPPTSNTAVPTQGCGEQGDFTMDFDDLPTFSGGSAKLFRRQSSNTTFSNSTSNSSGTFDITQEPPLGMRPYRHMLFSNGYVYAPRPVEPFAPASSPNVAVFLANGTGFRSGPPPNGLEPGEMGDGPYHEGDPAFFFDAKGAALGCDNAGPGPCTLEVTSMVWDNKTRDDVSADAQNYTIPPCGALQNCQLTKVEFPSSFHKLSGLRLRAIHGAEPRMFFVDDMKMRWADNSCAAGMQRQRSQ